MEAQKGLKSLLIRVGGLAVVGSLILLSLASLYPSTGAQTVAYPLIPLVMWSDGYHAVADVAYGLALDFLGNVVVVGTSGIIKYAEDGCRLWQAPYPGVAYGVATDSLADIVVAGTGGLVKLSSAGKQLWAVAGEFYKVTTAAGDLVVAVGPVGVRIYSPSGEAVGELNYPGEPYGVASSGDRVVVVGTGGLAAYELQARDRLWQLAYQGELRGVALDSEGGVIVVGSGGITKYSPSGRLIGQEPFLGEPQAVATSPSSSREPSQGDEIFVTGGYKSVEGDWDYRTVKYSSRGDEIWDVRYDGGYGDDIPYDIAVSPEGKIYVTGTSLLAEEAAAAEARVDQDYYTIQYAERPLPEVLGAQGLEVGERCPPGAIPVARFEVSNPNPLTGEEISFINRSYDPDGHLIAWSWEFGDGTTSAEWEPEHRYADDGSRTVTLTVVDDQLCPASATAEILIGNRPPEVDFYWNPLEPTDLEEALFIPEFEDLDGEVVYARWEFGDGTVVEWDSQWELGPPGHRSQIAYQYPDDGVYPVLLVVRDDDGAEAEVERNITVLNVPPEASFTWEAQPGAGELRADFRWDVEREVHGSYPEGFMPERPTDLDDIQFEDLSTSAGGEPGAIVFTAEGLDRDGRIVSYEWDFNNDGSTDAEGETVAWTFPQAGTYHVKLTATDDDGDSTTYEEDVEVEAVAGEIVEWEWDFGDNGASGEQHPRHWYQDNGVYEVTLTIWEEAGNSDSITKEIEVLNVPPVADFDWQFELPPDFLPTCWELFPEMGENFACQEPTIPANAGVVAFSDLSVDSENWLEIASWEWDFGNEGWACWEGEGDECLMAQNPKVLFLDETEEFLFHGDREVWLSVWDDDGDGGEDFPSSFTSKTVSIDNIPPYAACEWWHDEWSGWAELDCNSCEATYGRGDPEKTVSNEYITVTRTIYSWNCGGGEPSAILSPWGGANVELYITGSGTVEITETIPSGWGYWLGWPEECVTVLEEGEDYWSASVDLESCAEPGYVWIWYDLYLPYEEVPTGTYTISGVFTIPEVSELHLASEVVLCATVDVEMMVSFHGYGYDESPLIDPNGDEIISWAWIFDGFGTASGQEPNGGVCYEGEGCWFDFDDLACEFDEWWGWKWSYDLPVSLTVTDEPGDSTTVQETIHLEGPLGEIPA